MKATEVDEGLYSRQLYVLGSQAMRRIAGAAVLVAGCGGLGAEVAKNVVLAGVRRVVLSDHGRRSFCAPPQAAAADASTQFCAGAAAAQTAGERALATAAECAKLNPYVSVSADPRDVCAPDADLGFLREFACVCVLDAPSAAALARVDAFCRANGVAFLCAGVRGVFGAAFADFGAAFEVFDRDGEEPKEFPVASVVREDARLVVRGFPYARHELVDGDSVCFREVGGMDALNDPRLQTEPLPVTVLDPFSFAVPWERAKERLPEHTAGSGVAVQVKLPEKRAFSPLAEALDRPKLMDADLSRPNAPLTTHAAFLALDAWAAAHGNRLPAAWNRPDAESFSAVAMGVLRKLPRGSEVPEQEAAQLFKAFAFSCSGYFQPMVAFLGGVVGQEVLKAVSGKFSPLDQFLYADMREVMPVLDATPEEACAPRGHYLDAQAACIGWEAVSKITAAKLFMVGAGAIGCELLKNFAMMGFCSEGSGHLLVTDPDCIEKSNLNRQFLFREADIRKPKSEVATKVAMAMNPRMRIEAALDKVCPATEDRFTDEFFEGLDATVNALDNVIARLYMDGRCVSAQRPLLESGTLGTKGHVQVIVPHITECYSSQRDPPEKDVPLCTIHSFPTHIDHCIAWARDHFAKAFSNKPAEALKALGDPAVYIAKAREAGPSQLRVVRSITKLLRTRPRTFADCVVFGRRKFRDFFDSNIQALLAAFPIDSVAEGKPFWSPPKRPPKVVDFDPANPVHVSFVRSAAMIMASVFGILVPSQVSDDDLAQICASAVLPPPKRKKIKKSMVAEDSDADAAAEDESPAPPEEDYEKELAALSAALSEAKVQSVRLRPTEFEKDDDTNGHVDFVFATATTRAQNYGIQAAEKLEVKRVAGRIIPAIATTTAAVSGLVTCELVKVLVHAPAAAYRNAFLNLALPLFSFSEPAPPIREKLADGVYFTVWDSWVFRQQPGSPATLADFIAHFQRRFNLETTSVIQGQRIVYANMLPMHAKRLGQQMNTLLAHSDSQKFVELVVTFADAAGEDVNTPTIRFFF